MIFVPEAVTASGFYYDQGRDYSMNRQETVHISDCTLLSAEDHYDLSFREKIELCRLIDKLGVYSIDLCPIRQKKTDRLLIKSICSAVRYAAISVPVDIMDEESIMFAWEAQAPGCRSCQFRTDGIHASYQAGCNDPESGSDRAGMHKAY